MESIKLLSLFIEHTKNFQHIEEELWEFIRIPKERTNLKYDIFVDNNEAYNTYNHQLWLYADCGIIKVPITIEHRPKVLTFVKKNEFDFADVYVFIITNRILLEKLADKKIDSSIFFKLMKRVNESQEQTNVVMCEMATLHQNESKLPTLLWLDDDKLYEPHAPRVKFRADFQNKDTHHDSSMEIKDTDKIHNMPRNCNLSASQIKHISYFVNANREALLQLADKEIDFEHFKEHMVLVNPNGEVVNASKTTIGKFVNGFAICEKEGKYNYITEEGDYLYNDFVLDNATNFILYKDGVLVAYVTEGGRSFYINSNGEEIDLY